MDDTKTMTSNVSEGTEIRPDVYYHTIGIVNVVMIGDPSGDDWVLMDTGIPNSADSLMEIVSERFPRNNRPSAIILTHGHFDHVGGMEELIEEWKVPVFAHPGEFVYLSGQQTYPRPNIPRGRKSMTRMSNIFPDNTVNISSALLPLPQAGNIPGMPGWKWIHTPGHSPGHVSLFRESDKVLLAGDAFVTVRTDAFYKVITEKAEINGPPPYFTTDWEAANDSVKKLAALKPDITVTGHGPAMEGEELRIGLEELVNEFNEIAVPKYVK